MKSRVVVNFDLENKLFTKAYHGEISVDFIKKSWLEDYHENRFFLDTVGFIVDLRDAQLDFDLKESEKIADFYHNNLNIFAGKRIAFIVDSPEKTVYAVLFQTMDYGYESKPFSTIEAATKWVLMDYVM